MKHPVPTRPADLDGGVARDELEFLPEVVRMRVLGVVQGHEGVQGRVQEGLPHVQHRVGHAIVVVSAKNDAREGNAEGRTVDRTAVVHRQPQSLASRAAIVQHFRAGVCGAKSTNRFGRVYVELIFTLTKVVLVLNFHEQRFEASTREGFKLVCVVMPQGATRGFHFVKNEANQNGSWKE